MTTFGPELLTNGDFEASTGIGAGSSIGPGWGSDYAPCGPNLFAGPCGGGNYAFFTTNAGQATGGAHAAIPVLGTRSMAVNVSGNTAAAIARWANIPLVNGQSYRLQVSAAIMGNPFSVAVRINGGAAGNIPVSAPTALNQWQTTVTDFVYTGPTGNQLVGLYSNSGVLGGNDHTFDNISLKAISPDGASCGCCPVVADGCYQSGNSVNFSRDLGSVGRVMTPNTATFANFAGSGIDVTVAVGGGATLTGNSTSLTVNVPPPNAVPVTITFSAPVFLRRFGVSDFDVTSPMIEQMFDFTTPFSAVTGTLQIAACSGSGAPGPQPAGCIGGTVNNSTGEVVFPGPSVTSVGFTIGRVGGLGQFLTSLFFSVATAGELPAYPMICDDIYTWFNTDGNEVPAGSIQAC